MKNKLSLKKTLLSGKKLFVIIPMGLALAGCGTELMSQFVPGTITASQLNQISAAQYAQTLQESNTLPRTHKEVIRLQKIADRLIALAPEYHPEAAYWDWQVNLINDLNTVNASCYPNGRIVFYTGIIQRLKLTDDEIAMIMGHEIVHALKEHSLYQINKEALTNAAFAAGASKLGGNATTEDLLAFGQQMLGLSFSRADEKESDLIGQELAARAGYNPKAAVSVWEKMMKLSGDASTSDFFSTHPASATRTSYLAENLPNVTPLYKDGLVQRQQDEKASTSKGKKKGKR